MENIGKWTKWNSQRGKDVLLCVPITYSGLTVKTNISIRYGVSSLYFHDVEVTIIRSSILGSLIVLNLCFNVLTAESGLKNLKNTLCRCALTPDPQARWHKQWPAIQSLLKWRMTAGLSVSGAGKRVEEAWPWQSTFRELLCIMSLFRK